MGNCLCKEKKSKSSRPAGNSDGNRIRYGQGTAGNHTQAGDRTGIQETNSDDSFPYTLTGTSEDNVTIPSIHPVTRLGRRGMCI